MNFENLQDIKEQFTKGKIKSLPEELSVDGIKYKLLNSTTYSFDEILEGKKKSMVVYSLDPEKENKERYKEKHTDADDPKSFQDRIVFVWATTRLTVRPVEVKFVSKGRMTQVMVKEATDQNVIGDVVAGNQRAFQRQATLRI